jgi:hypothetical protein
MAGAGCSRHWEREHNENKEVRDAGEVEAAGVAL